MAVERIGCLGIALLLAVPSSSFHVTLLNIGPGKDLSARSHTDRSRGITYGFVRHLQKPQIVGLKSVGEKGRADTSLREGKEDVLAKEGDTDLGVKKAEQQSIQDSLKAIINPLASMQLAPVLLLNLVTILWGSQHTVIKMAVDMEGSSPAGLNLSRFLIAALVFLPLSKGIWGGVTDEQQKNEKGGDTVADAQTDRGEYRNKVDNVHTDQVPRGLPGVWTAGLELGVWMFAGYAAQSVGLLYTSASRSAFLLYLNVKFVPLLSSVVYRKQISIETWIAAAIALTGTALLGYDGAPPNIGDAWSIAAALASAIFIIRLGTFSRLFDAKDLNATSLVSVTLLCLVWLLAVDRPETLEELLPSNGEQLAAAAYLGLVTTALTNFIQTIGQRNISAERAAIIYAMDPVYGAAFAYVFLGEHLGAQGLLGCGLLFLATIFNNISKDTDSSGHDRSTSTDGTGDSNPSKPKD